MYFMMIPCSLCWERKCQSQDVFADGDALANQITLHVLPDVASQSLTSTKQEVCREMNKIALLHLIHLLSFDSLIQHQDSVNE